MYDKRKYQDDFVEALAKAVARFLHVIGCLPTGGGKTACFIKIAERAIAKGKTVLILTESKKIFKQIKEKKNGIIINAKVKHLFVEEGNIYIAMVQTMKNRPAILEQFVDLKLDLLVLNDEAHVGTSTKLLKQLLGSYIIGFTATPDYNSAPFLPEIYKACIVGAQVDDLIQAGYLLPCNALARVDAELDKLKIKNGEFTEESQQLVFETDAVYDGLLEDLRNIPFHKAMVFCASIKHCDDVADMLGFNGIKNVRIHSENEMNEFDLMEFEIQKDCNVCVSVAMLNKGYDFPAIDFVALLFKSTKLTRYLQSNGRASRPHGGQKYFTSVDYGGNWCVHGLWDWDRPWETMWLPPAEKKKKKKKDEIGVAPLKMCPECNHIIPASSMVCRFCGYLFDGIQKELKQGELIEINEKYNILKGRTVGSLTPKELAIYVRLKNKRAYGIRIAKAHEQQTPGWLEEYGREMNYSYRWPYYMKNQINGEKIEFEDIVLR